MGLSDWLAHRAVRSTHVLLVEVPGHSLTAMAIERACAARGWQMATSSADADLLVVCASPGPELGEVAEALWEQMPGPRARVHIATAAEVEPALDDAARQLLDNVSQRRDAEQRPQAPLRTDAKDGMDHDGMDHDGMDHDGMDHEGMDHEGTDHEGMDMAPEGIPLAQGGEDRDGLEMDVLHVRLGPVLPYWPAGLVLRCALQGDVIVEATVEVVDSDSVQRDEEMARATGPMYAAQRCHSAARLLALAGWADGAARARTIRDALLDAAGEGGESRDVDLGSLSDRVSALRRRVAGSRLLQWSLHGLGEVGDDDIERQRLPEPMRGDVHARLLGMLDRAGDALSDAGGSHESGHRQVSASAIGELVTGLELAAARLVVASLDLDVAMISRRTMADV